MYSARSQAIQITHEHNMKVGKLFLSLVVLTSVLAHHAALSSSRFHGLSDPKPPARTSSGFDSTYRLSLPKPVQDKNFYLLSLFQRNQGARKLISQNKTLRQLAKDKMLALKKAPGCD